MSDSMITPEMIEAALFAADMWDTAETRHCMKAALTAALALHKPGMPGEIEELIARLQPPWEHPAESLRKEAATALRSLVLEVERVKLSLSFAQSDLCKGAVIEAAQQRIRELEADQAKRIERGRQYMNRIVELEADLAAAKAKPLAMPEGLPEGPWTVKADHQIGAFRITARNGELIAFCPNKLGAPGRLDDPAYARAIASFPDLYAELAKAVAMADELWVAREQIRGELDAARNKTIEECVALAETMGDALTAEELAYEIRALATGETK